MILSIIAESTGISGDFDLADPRLRPEQYEIDGVLSIRVVISGFLTHDQMQSFLSVLPLGYTCSYIFGDYSGRGFNDSVNNKVIIRAIPTEI